MKIIILILLLEIIFRPRFDFARKGRILLWYGHKKIKYIIVWQLPNVNE